MTETLLRPLRGALRALRSRLGIVFAVTALFVGASVFLPPLVLSVARKPVDYFTFNPWLPGLPDYLASGVPLQQKLDFLPNLALFWFSADSPFGGVDWGFAVTVTDLLRFLALGAVLGLYFALVFYCRTGATPGGSSRRFAQGGGASGAVASVFGITTGGCTVMGCGAPVIPVVGLAFAGLSSGTLALLAGVSRVATIAVFIVIALGVIYLGWVAGERKSRSPDAADQTLPTASRPRRS